MELYNMGVAILDIMRHVFREPVEVSIFTVLPPKPYRFFLGMILTPDHGDVLWATANFGYVSLLWYP